MDSIADLIPEATVLSRDQPLSDVFDRYGAFMSLTSSAIIEAALRGRTAIQLYDETFDFDHLGQRGASYSCNVDHESILAVLKALKEDKLPPLPVHPEYITVPKDLDKRLHEIYQLVVSNPSPSNPLGTSSGKVHCVVGTASLEAELIQSVTPTGYVTLPKHSWETKRPIEGVVLLERDDGAPNIPANVDFQDLYDLLMELRQGVDSNLVFSRSSVIYALPKISQLRNVTGLTIVIEAPKAGGDSTPYDSYRWLERLALSFEAARTIKSEVIICGAKNRALHPCPPGDTVGMRAALTYRVLIDHLPLASVTHPADLETGQVSQLAHYLRQETDAAKAEISNLMCVSSSSRRDTVTLSDVENKAKFVDPEIVRRYHGLVGMVAEFDRVRATRFWKFREAATGLIRKLRR